MCRAQPLSLVPPLPPLQDPEVQKHATQILRNMLRQEEAELQVRRFSSKEILLPGWVFPPLGGTSPLSAPHPSSQHPKVRRLHWRLGRGRIFGC